MQNLLRMWLFVGALLVASGCKTTPETSPAASPAAGAGAGAGTTATSTPKPKQLLPGVVVDSSAGDAQGGPDDPNCGGKFPTAPQHQMEIGKGVLAVVLTASRKNLPIRVEWKGNRWCSKDSGDGKHTLGRGSWSEGTYQVYVGILGDGDKGPYELEARTN